ncbi:MAG: Cna B-type domain-containing protein, partial [Clostridia bacterium]|nr:Cna B-type domain-containing protein [Clostridia bacterium]
TVTLYADGVAVDATPVWSGTDGDTWTYTFSRLPAVNENGETIEYTVKEEPVENYEGIVRGLTITNRLIPRDAKVYRDLEGTKTWDDNDNAMGKRPNHITVRLYRNGVEIEKRDVTAASDWSYSFGRLPMDDGYGNEYTYELREDAVPGYFSRINGMDVLNKLLAYDRPDEPGPNGDNDTPYVPKGRNEVPSRRTGTGRPGYEKYTEEELEELFDLFGYGTPLWGGLMPTGDEVPAYPFIFGGIGVMALGALLIISKRRRYE